MRSPDEPVRSLPGNHLDELINSFVQKVRKRGYSLQELRQHVRARLLTQPPDHLLVVEQELGLRHLLRAELRDKLAFRVEACSTDELALNADLAIGALVVSPPGMIKYFETLLPRDRPAIPISFCTVNEHVEVIRELQQPSIIVLASVSEVCLEVARGVLSGVVGQRHSLQVYLLYSRGKTSLSRCRRYRPLRLNRLSRVASSVEGGKRHPLPPYSTRLLGTHFVDNARFIASPTVPSSENHVKSNPNKYMNKHRRNKFVTTSSIGPSSEHAHQSCQGNVGNLSLQTGGIVPMHEPKSQRRKH